MATALEARDRDEADPSARALLLTLRREGPLTPDELALRLGASRLVILRRLRDLVRLGHVERRLLRHGVGRPRHTYQASPLRDGTIPGGYDEVAISLLEGAREIGGHVLLAKIFDARSRAQAATIRGRLERAGLAAAPLLDQARELCAVQNELGFAAELEPAEGGVRLLEYNCPIFRVVESSQAACEAEVATLRDVLRSTVTRESHILAGARCCSFRIERRVWDASQMAAQHALQPAPSVAARGWSATQMRVAPGNDARSGGGRLTPDAAQRGWDARQVAWKPARPDRPTGE